jgi:hypothetical protein
MIQRVYWRVEHANPLRQAGPWWYRDFKDWATVWRFAMDHVTCFAEIRVAPLEQSPGYRSVLNIVPPKNAEVWLKAKSSPPGRKE